MESQPATNDGDERGRPALGQASGVRALPAGRLSVARWRATTIPQWPEYTVRTASQVRDGSKNAAHLRGSGGALDRVDVLFRDLVDRRINRAHGETLGSERVDIIERGVKVKPPFHVAEHHWHAVVIGRDQLIRLVGQDREGRNRFAFDVRIIPDAGEHDGLAV